ncbi:hypothetical protein AMS68_004788 [Peltaster fructicola]|uniref:Uncharacterized protein n=1 Tax=Peltaster fructicola TaxID=286661 RepID=A0A6H0XX86_9PEZI|nr:hypothetical protein AMS68_004788 [Peltaster fructicola]
MYTNSRLFATSELIERMLSQTPEGNMSSRLTISPARDNPRRSMSATSNTPSRQYEDDTDTDSPEGEEADGFGLQYSTYHSQASPSKVNNRKRTASALSSDEVDHGDDSQTPTSGARSKKSKRIASKADDNNDPGSYDLHETADKAVSRRGAPGIGYPLDKSGQDLNLIGVRQAKRWKRAENTKTKGRLKALKFINSRTPLHCYNEWLGISDILSYTKKGGTYFYEIVVKDYYYHPSAKLKYVILAHGQPHLVEFHKTHGEHGVPLEATYPARPASDLPEYARRFHPNYRAATPSSIASSRSSQPSLPATKHYDRSDELYRRGLTGTSRNSSMYGVEPAQPTPSTPCPMPGLKSNAEFTRGISRTIGGIHQSREHGYELGHTKAACHRSDVLEASSAPEIRSEVGNAHRRLLSSAAPRKDNHCETTASKTKGVHIDDRWSEGDLNLLGHMCSEQKQPAEIAVFFRCTEKEVTSQVMRAYGAVWKRKDKR